MPNSKLKEKVLKREIEKKTTLVPGRSSFTLTEVPTAKLKWLTEKLDIRRHPLLQIIIDLAYEDEGGPPLENDNAKSTG